MNNHILCTITGYSRVRGHSRCYCSCVAMAPDNTVVCNEVLCYVQNTYGTAPCDNIARQIEDFYDENELNKAKQVLVEATKEAKVEIPSKYTANHRSNALKREKDANDILQIYQLFAEADVEIAVYAAKDLKRILTDDPKLFDTDTLRAEMMKMRQQMNIIVDNINTMSAVITKQQQSAAIRMRTGPEARALLSAGGGNSVPQARKRFTPARDQQQQKPPVNVGGGRQRSSSVDGSLVATGRPHTPTAVGGGSADPSVPVTGDGDSGVQTSVFQHETQQSTENTGRTFSVHEETDNVPATSYSAVVDNGRPWTLVTKMKYKNVTKVIATKTNSTLKEVEKLGAIRGLFSVCLSGLLANA